MDITTGRLMQVGAFFYEQALIEAYKSGELVKSRERLKPYIDGALEGNFSLTKKLSNQKLKDEWLKELGAVSRLATKRFQLWMEGEGFSNLPYLGDYKHVDEKGRVFKKISLAADSPAKENFYGLIHRPSITFTEVEGRPYPQYENVLVPLFGWTCNSQEMSNLQEKELIFYAENPSAETFAKDFLEIKSE